MFLKKKIIVDVFNFRLYKKTKLFFHSDHSTYVQYFDFSIDEYKKKNLGSKVKEYYFLKGDILITDDENNGYWFKDDLFVKIENYTFGSISEGLSIGISKHIVSYYPINIEQTGININSLEVLFRNKLTSLRFEQDLLISSFKKGFSLLEPYTGTPLWQYDIGERYDYYSRNEQYLESPTEFHQAEIRKIIGVYQEILWISLNTGRLIGLSVHDGAVVYDIAVPNDYPHRFFAVAQYSHLVAEQGKIIGLHAHWYWELDLKNPIESYKLYILDDECTKHSLDVDHLRFYCLVGNELFFAQEEWAQEPSYVGIFDIQTKKITWTSHELGEDNVFQGIKKVEYQSNRLYVLDKASCLHIFEREANF